MASQLVSNKVVQKAPLVDLFEILYSALMLFVV